MVGLCLSHLCRETTRTVSIHFFWVCYKLVRAGETKEEEKRVYQFPVYFNKKDDQGLLRVWWLKAFGIIISVEPRNTVVNDVVLCCDVVEHACCNTYVAAASFHKLGDLLISGPQASKGSQIWSKKQH